MQHTNSGRLFVCTYKIDPAYGQWAVKAYEEGASLSVELQALSAKLQPIRHEHLQYWYDLSKRGVIWASGPSADFTTGLTIYAVDSLEEARKLLQNEPYYVNGVFYDVKYFEWTIHLPFSKAAPAHREKLQQSFREVGIEI